MIVTMGASTASSDRPGESLPAHITVAADTAELRKLRAHVVSATTQHHAPTHVTEAFELAASELATNVIQHTSAERLTVIVDRDDDGWMIDVSDADHLDTATLGSAATSGAPEPERLSGRGLVIVQSIMDAVELVDVDGHQHLRCFKRA